MPQEYLDLIQARVGDALKDAGSNEVQQDDGRAMLPRYLMMTNGNVIVRETGEPFTLDWIKTHKPFLLPREHNPSEADAAFLSGNMTLRSKMARDVGIEEANRVARVYGLKDIFDHRVGKLPGERSDDDTSKQDPRSNPWADTSEAGEARRISYIGAHGASAASRMAKSANRTITGQPLRKTRAAG